MWAQFYVNQYFYTDDAATFLGFDTLSQTPIMHARGHTQCTLGTLCHTDTLEAV